MQRQEANQKVVDSATATKNRYGGKTDEELAAMPATPNADGSPNKLFKNALEERNNAEEVLRPISPNNKTRVIENEADPSQQQVIYETDKIPPGWRVHDKPLASQITTPGTEKDFTGNALKGYGVTDKTPPAQKAALEKYLHDWWNWKQSQTTSGSQEHLETDPKSGELVAVKTGSMQTRGQAAPKPPAGFSPLGEDGLPQQQAAPSAGGMGRSTLPRQQARGSMGSSTLPSGVRDTGLQSLAGKKWDASTAESTRKGYEQIETAYQRALANNAKDAPNPQALQGLNEQAMASREAAKASLVLARAAQIKAVGGDPWKKNGRGEQFVKFPGDDGVYGTMDGVNWVNINTGMPYGGK